MNQSHIQTLSNSEFADLVGEEHQSDDLYVHINKDFSNKIPITVPFRSKNYIIIIVVSGQLKIQTNLITHILKKNDSISLTINTVSQILKISTNLKVVSVSFSNKFMFENFFKKSNVDAFDFFTINQITKIKLTSKETKIFKTVAKLLKRYNSSMEETLFKTEIIRNTFGLILHLYAEVFKKTYPNLKIELNRQEDLSARFWNILQENLKSERTVQFYAEALNVTTGHLSKVLKQSTGKNTSQLIEEAVIMEAKILLEIPQLSVAQISEELQFSDQSFFGKYFKKYTGFTPSVYRKNYSK